MLFSSHLSLDVESYMFDPHTGQFLTAVGARGGNVEKITKIPDLVRELNVEFRLFEDVIITCIIDEVTFTNCSFINVSFESNIFDTTFRRCHFLRCKFTGIRINGSTFETCDFSEQLSNFDSSKLDYTTFVHCFIKLVTFKRSDLSFATFEECRLEDLMLRESVFVRRVADNLTHTRFRMSDSICLRTDVSRCNLGKADFSRSQFNTCSFESSDLSSASFRAAISSEVEFKRTILEYVNFSDTDFHKSSLSFVTSWYKATVNIKTATSILKALDFVVEKKK